MRIYVIKHKGASNWQNLYLERELTFTDGDKIYAGLMFFRKKDAEKYRKTFEYPEGSEVIGATLDKCMQDNRRK